MDSFFYLVLSGGFLAVTAQTCDHAHYERCLTDLKKFTQKDNFIFANSDIELQAECMKAQRDLGCLTRYSRKCLPLEEREMFTDGIAGSQAVTVALCTDETDLKSRYLSALPCLQNISDGVRYCKEKYERNNRDITNVEYEDKLQLECCSFYGYQQCLRRLMDLENECEEDDGNILQEIAVLNGGNFVRNTCPEQFEKCKGTATRTPSTEMFTLIVSFLLIVFCKYV